MKLTLSPAEKRIIAVFVAWRCGLMLISWFATAWFPPGNLVSAGLAPTASTPLRDSWLLWDGSWFEVITRLGYAGALAERQAPIVFNFFPLYPLLGYGVGVLAGDFGVGLLLVSNTCTLLACLVAYRLARLDLDEAGAERAVMFLLVYPFSFFLGAAYCESLFLLLVLLSFLAARQKRWAWCGALGALACLTRHVGILLLPVLVVEFLYQERRLRKEMLYLLLVPLGMVAYFGYLQVAFGDATWFVRSQQYAIPPRHMTWQIWTPITAEMPNLFGSAFAPRFVIRWAEVLSIGLAVGAGLLAFRRLRPSYGLLCLLAVIPPLTSGLTLGFTRYVIVLFPIFFLMGGRGEESGLQRGWMMVSAMLLGFFTLLFTRNLFVG